MARYTASPLRVTKETDHHLHIVISGLKQVDELVNDVQALGTLGKYTIQKPDGTPVSANEIVAHFDSVKLGASEDFTIVERVA
jgi:hypothetical protein